VIGSQESRSACRAAPRPAVADHDTVGNKRASSICERVWDSMGHLVRRSTAPKYGNL
jgi:hypothetical protein